MRTSARVQALHHPSSLALPALTPWLAAGALLLAAAAARGQEPPGPACSPGPLAVKPATSERAPEALTEGAGPSFEDQVMEIVNQERWNNGQLAPLKRHALLDTSSELHSTNMASRDFFAHCDPDTGTQSGGRMTAVGYIWNFASENIAAGYTTPTAVMAGWMASAGHRANILSTSANELGIGYFFQSGDAANVRVDLNSDCVPESSNNGPYFHYWTQNFGRRSSNYPVVINREAYQTSTPNVQLYLYGTGWATQMRLRNETGTWTSWQTFSANVPWTLSAGGGVKTVNVELRNAALTVLSASDTIVLEGAPVNLIFSDSFESGNTLAWQ